MKSLSIRQLSKTYASGTQALKNVDLDVARGDFFALLGANGAGKTTLIGIVTGLVNKTSGSVEVLGHSIDTRFSKAKKLIGVVPQEFNFNMFEKVQDILVTQAGYFGVDRKEALKETEAILRRLSLWDKRSSPSRQLSGGMKRRLMIARALIHRPQLLILDEPTAGVDVELRHEMWEFLREMNRGGLTILMTTHYLEEVEQMCRHAAIIKNGEIITNDSVKRLVQLMDTETYTVTVRETKGLEGLRGFHPKVVDENSFEVELDRKESLNGFVSQLTNAGMVVMDIRPQGHRLEKLFLKILRE
ncbi:MAG: ABC transporter ATP-binding protein [Candidatus Omnitrophota bacterium]|nr:ABC transporter ATP-binding protein [Candidatus Omnitrophota bacterium]MDZ4241337.1 ABC transporter ATP-binding protein [Candidatus Omnitrophota bacterium]